MKKFIISLAVLLFGGIGGRGPHGEGAVGAGT